MPTPVKPTHYRTIILDRIAFCSEACMANALDGDTHTGRKLRNIPAVVAAVIQCYGCGQYLDDAREGN